MEGRTIFKMEEQYYYQDGNGLMVFTEAYHQKRGFCCGCGCRHCPYEYEAVQEPRRSELKAKREMMSVLNPPEADK